MAQALLIDGYNLLNATDIFGDDTGRTNLESTRNALLAFLAEVLAEQQRSQTTIVFDGRDAPPGLPRMLTHAGITIRFSRRDQEADDVLEELIESATAPMELTVVSSDHRVQRAARRRKATYVDSDVWFAEIRKPRGEAAAEPAEKPATLSDDDVSQWLDEFGIPPSS